MDIETLERTRRSLHGVAEHVLGGPQRRATRRIQLRVVPGGFATTASPVLRVDGTELVVDEESRLPLRGSFGGLAEAAGVEYGMPPDVYHDHSGVEPDDEVDVDPAAAALLARWWLLGDAALRVVAPRLTPVLWPEHFDVAVDLEQASVGCSPGDEFSAEPYAYVSVADHPADGYWNAPFGAARVLADADSVAALVDFWTEGLSRLRDADEVRPPGRGDTSPS